ncbi:alpha/beta hydrolase-fold protein [Amycolatopsis rhabdoformis]|uniref:Alpha/beta hydrolase-fold protein n=1 Tax=Amycolatopsis rhabdoformis TaxID=1448059 RepID=A0ABZ1I3D1_9PSEU|nr:alpha/beta hydrolase-fold protein [Amycolatopsis rhabdoformis]WSE28760.1 alpha/beta hydrolase-fold protein [Amycolatopsis rhabdoformis]
MHLSSIRLDSPVEVIVIAVLAVLAVVAVPWFWDRWRKRKQLGRSASVLTAVVLIVVSVALVGNLIGGFFPTLGSLLGTGVYAADSVDADAGGNGVDLERMRDLGVVHAREGKGTVVHMKVTGRRTGLARDVDVYLPPQYFQQSFHALRFPAIEWIPNYPSGPEVAAAYHLPEQLDAAIAKHALPPTVVVIPDPTGVPKVGHDTECVDEVGGTPNDTYLSADVREWAIQRLNLNPARGAWAIAGWSSGGYCALNLVTRHPQWFATAASVSGYDRAQVDSETEDLFHGRQDIDDANNVRVNLRLHPSPVDLLAISGDKENYESFAIDQMRAAAQSPVRFSSWRIPDAGHNMNTFKSQLPDVLAWLGARLPGPSMAGRAVDVSGGVRPWPLPKSGARGGLSALEE